MNKQSGPESDRWVWAGLLLSSENDLGERLKKYQSQLTAVPLIVETGSTSISYGRGQASKSSPIKGTPPKKIKE